MPGYMPGASLAVSIALRFIPTVVRDNASIRDAQAARGVRLNYGSTRDRVLNQAATLVPTVITSLERGFNLAESMAILLALTVGMALAARHDHQLADKGFRPETPTHGMPEDDQQRRNSSYSERNWVAVTISDSPGSASTYACSSHSNASFTSPRAAYTWAT